MQEIRLGNMFYEQRGPLVFSASLHITLLVVFGIWSLMKPDREPEELVFELVSPPSGGYLQEQPLEPVTYERGEQAELPTEDEIVLPERPMIPVEVVQEVVEPVEQPLVEISKPEEAPPKPQLTSIEDFRRMHGNEVKNVGKTPSRTTKRIDLSSDIRKLQQSLSAIGLESLPSTDLSSMSTSDQNALASYLGRLKNALKNAVERHPIPATPLQSVVSCDISGGGHISNVLLVRGSGDSVYDQKVVAAFKKLRLFDAPPDGKGFKGISFRFVQE